MIRLVEFIENLWILSLLSNKYKRKGKINEGFSLIDLYRKRKNKSNEKFIIARRARQTLNYQSIRIDHIIKYLDNNRMNDNIRNQLKRIEEVMEI